VVLRGDFRGRQGGVEHPDAGGLPGGQFQITAVDSLTQKRLFFEGSVLLLEESPDLGLKIASWEGRKFRSWIFSSHAWRTHTGLDQTNSSLSANRVRLVQSGLGSRLRRM